LRSACAATCAGLNSKGTSLHVRLTNAFARLAKFTIKMQQMPIVPRNVQTSERSRHGPHLTILSMQDGYGRRPLGVHLWPMTVISSVHKTVLGLLYVLLQYLVRCTMRLSPWKCSQMKCWMLGFSGIRSSVLSGNTYLSVGLRISTLLIYGTVVLGISGWSIKVMSLWNISTEFVQPIGKVTRCSAL
jgi:hypothetical protein